MCRCASFYQGGNTLKAVHYVSLLFVSASHFRLNLLSFTLFSFICFFHNAYYYNNMVILCKGLLFFSFDTFPRKATYFALFSTQTDTMPSASNFFASFRVTFKISATNLSALIGISYALYSLIIISFLSDVASYSLTGTT